MFKIEKGHELPQSSRGRKESQYPFASMEVGDSFFMPIPDEADFTAHRSRLAQAAYHFKHRNPAYNFTTAKEAGGVRCWRIAP